MQIKTVKTALHYASEQSASRNLQALTNIEGQVQMTANQILPMVRFCKKCQVETVRLPNSNNRCKPCANATTKAYHLANPEKSRADAAAWRKANPEKHSSWRKANPEKHKESVKASKKAKAEKFALYEAFYLANNPSKKLGFTLVSIP